MVVERMLLALEEGFWDAAASPEFYHRHMADDGLMVFPAPVGVLTKERAVKEVSVADPWAEFRLRDSRVVRLTDGSAVLVYTATARREGDDHPYMTYASSVYANRGGEWLLVLHQQTPVPGH